MMRRSILACAIALATGGRAAAQPAAAQAEAQFDRGKQLMAEGKTAEACAAFESSQKLEPLVTTLLNLAACREKNGELASAWAWFVEAERQTRGKSGGERKLNQTAKERAAKLAGRLSKLTITVPHEVPELEVLRDATPVERGTWNTALPVDGGTFTIAARAPGHRKWSTQVTIATERDAKTVEIPALTKAGGTPQPGDDTAEPDGPRPPAPGRSRVLPLALAVTGAVLAGGAVGFELWGRSKYDAARVEPDDATQEALWRAANTRRYTAIGLGAAAAVSIGASVVLFVRTPREPRERAGTASRVHMQPIAGASAAGLVVHGSF
jgi:hypothetical protein